MIWRRITPSVRARTLAVTAAITATGLALAGCGSPVDATSSTPRAGGRTPSGSSDPNDPSAPEAPKTPSASSTSGTPSSGKPPRVNCSQVKCIALTFDDGPGPFTGELLDVLRRESVPATFFLVGERVVRYPGVVKREAAEGHEIGNHTWDHKDLAKLTAAEVRQELARSADAIEAAGAPRPTLLRPPYGSVSETVKQVAGMPYIMWRVDPEDWKYRDAAKIAQNIVAKAKVGRIVLSHDIYPSTVEAMPSVIQQLKVQGYTFVTVSDLMAGTAMRNGTPYFNRPPSMDPPSSGAAGGPSESGTTTPETPGDAPAESAK